MLDTYNSDVVVSKVTGLRREHARSAIHTLTLAFEADPPCRWLFPEDRQYYRYFPDFARAFGGAAIHQGTAIATCGHAGVALWLPPGHEPDEAALTALIEESVPVERKEGVFALFAEMGRLHPTEEHWYLPLIGVEPGHQGRGLGSALLRPVLDECDAMGLPAYLEATSLRSIPFYARHGFKPTGAIKKGGCPPIVTMLRPPGSGK